MRRSMRAAGCADELKIGVVRNARSRRCARRSGGRSPTFGARKARLKTSSVRACRMNESRQTQRKFKGSHSSRGGKDGAPGKSKASRCKRRKMPGYAGRYRWCGELGDALMTRLVLRLGV